MCELIITFELEIFDDSVANVYAQCYGNHAIHNIVEGKKKTDHITCDDITFKTNCSDRWQWYSVICAKTTSFAKVWKKNVHTDTGTHIYTLDYVLAQILCDYVHILLQLFVVVAIAANLSFK